jgi:hypothetical protein
MADTTELEVAGMGIQLIDDAYLAWFGAESECETKLRDWFQATGDQREPAYRAYLAALDREEASARDMERLWEVASSRHEARLERRERVSE